MEKITSREILHQIREEAAKKDQRQPLQDFDLCRNRVSGRRIR